MASRSIRASTRDLGAGWRQTSARAIVRSKTHGPCSAGRVLPHASAVNAESRRFRSEPKSCSGCSSGAPVTSSRRLSGEILSPGAPLRSLRLPALLSFGYRRISPASPSSSSERAGNGAGRCRRIDELALFHHGLEAAIQGPDAIFRPVPPSNLGFHLARAWAVSSAGDLLSDAKAMGGILGHVPDPS